MYSVFSKYKEEVFFYFFCTLIIAFSYFYNDLQDFLTVNSINISVMSDLLTILGILLGVLLPISLNILISASNKYDSEYVKRILIGHKDFKNMLLAIIGLTGIIILKLFTSIGENKSDILSNNLIVLLSLMIFIHSIYILIKFCFYLFNYLSTTTRLIEDLNSKISSFFHSFYSIKSSSDNIVKCMDGYSEILKIELKKQNYDVVNDTLSLIHGLYLNALHNAYNYDVEFQGTFVTYKNVEGLENYTITENSFDVVIDCYIGLLNLLVEVATEKDSYMSQLDIYYMQKIILFELTKLRNTRNSVSIILQNFTKEYSKYEVRQLPYKYRVGYQWYIDFLKIDFYMEEEYRQLFKENINKHLRLFIDSDSIDVYKAFLGSLHNGISITEHNFSLMDLYRKLNLNDNKKWKDVESSHSVFSSIREINSFQVSHEKDLNDIIFRINNLRKILLSEYPESCELINKKLDEYSEFLNDKIVVIIIKRLSIFMISYSIFRSRPSFIKLLIDFKQPIRSETTWLGHDVVFLSPQLIFKQYIENALTEYHVDHHDSNVYNRDAIYLILAVLNYRYKIDITNIGNNYGDIYGLSQHKFLAKKLLEMDNSIDSILEFVIDNKSINADDIHKGMKEIFDGYIDSINQKRSRLVLSSKLSDVRKNQLEKILEDTFEKEFTQFTNRNTADSFELLDKEPIDFVLNLHKSNLIESWDNNSLDYLDRIVDYFKQRILMKIVNLKRKEQKSYSTLISCLAEEYLKSSKLIIVFVNSIIDIRVINSSDNSINIISDNYWKYGDRDIMVYELYSNMIEGKEILMFDIDDCPIKGVLDRKNLKFKYGDGQYIKLSSSKVHVDDCQDEISFIDDISEDIYVDVQITKDIYNSGELIDAIVLENLV